MCPPSKENNWNKFTNWKDDNYDLAKGKVPRTFSDLDNEILDSGNWRMKYEGTSNSDWILNKGYKPQSGERTFEGYVKNNVPIDKETKLFTKSSGFNTNPKNVDG